MSKTPNYELNKPAQTDFYDVDVQNENMDKIDTALANKVDKVVGKGLSTNDYNATDKGKVDNLPTDTNTELGKKVNNQTFDNHKNDTNIHTTSAEKEKWNKGTPVNYNDWCSFNSYKGWLDWCDSFRLKLKYIIPIQPKMDEYYLSNIKGKAVLQT